LTLSFLLQLDECDWVSCIDPPVPAGLKIKSDWDGFALYKFHSSAVYTCEKEEGLFFEDSRERKSFEIKCLPGGKWEEPRVWPRCVKSKYTLHNPLNL
jgi:hypothetical protein